MRAVKFMRLRRLLIAPAMGAGLMLAAAVGHVGHLGTSHADSAADRVAVSQQQRSLMTTDEISWG